MKNIVGLDISTASVKIVELRRTSKGLELVRFGTEAIVPTEEGDTAAAETLPASGRSDLIIQAIKRILVRNKIRSRQAIGFIPSESVLVNYLYLPPTPPEELGQMMRWEIERAGHFTAREAASSFKVQHQFADAKGGRKIEVLLAAAHKDFITKYMVMVRRAGLKLVGVAIKPLAYLNTFKQSFQSQPDKFIALLDIGSKITNIVVFQGGRSCFFREINIGGKDLTKAIADATRMSFESAQRAKYEYGIPPKPETDEIKEISISMRPVLERLTSVVERTFGFFDRQFKHEPIEKIIITGGSSRLQYIEAFLSNRLGMPVEIADPLTGLQIDPALENTASEISPHLSLALGLAHQECVQDINLLPPLAQRLKENIKAIIREKGPLKLAFPILVPLLIAFFFGLNALSKSYIQRIKEIKDKSSKYETVHIPHLEKMAQDTKDLEQQVAALEKLTAGRVPWYNIFHEFSRAIIPEKLWLTNLEFKQVTNPTAGYELKIAGYALSLSYVTDFTVQLDESGYFKKVDLISSDRVPGAQPNSPDLIEFKIEILLDIP